MKKSLLLLCLLPVGLLMSCGQNSFEGQEDKNTTEAKRFASSKNLDTGNYDSVLSDPNATPIDYAAAAMGKVGLAPNKLLTAVSDLANATSGNQSNLSGITKVTLIDSNSISYLAEAKVRLSSAVAAAKPGVMEKNSLTTTIANKEIYFQKTLVDLLDIITALAQVGDRNATYIPVAYSTGTKTFSAADGIDAYEAEALGSYVKSKYNSTTKILDLTVDLGATYGQKNLSELIVGDVDDIVKIVNNDLAELGLNSQVKTTLKNLTTGKGSLDYDGDGTITGQDISDYLVNVLGGSK